jgi:hypothetical protein
MAKRLRTTKRAKKSRSIKSQKKCKSSRRIRGGDSDDYEKCKAANASAFTMLRCIAAMRKLRLKSESEPVSKMENGLLAYIATLDAVRNEKVIKNLENKLQTIVTISAKQSDYDTKLGELIKEYNIQPVSVKQNNTMNSILKELAKLDPININYSKKLKNIQSRLNIVKKNRGILTESEVTSL